MKKKTKLLLSVLFALILLSITASQTTAAPVATLNQDVTMFDQYHRTWIFLPADTSVGVYRVTPTSTLVGISCTPFTPPRNPEQCAWGLVPTYALDR